MTRFVPVTISGQGDPASAFVMSPEWAADASAAGIDPSSIDCVVWPVGASDHGRVTVLMHHNEIAKLTQEQGAVAPLHHRLGRSRHLQCLDASPIPIVASGRVTGQQVEGDAYYAVTFVDERFNWSRWPVDANYNVLTDGKVDAFKSSLFADGSNWTPQLVMLFLLVQVGVGSVYWPTPEAYPELYDETEIRDLQVQGLSLGQVIDLVCRRIGVTFVALPNNGGGFEGPTDDHPTPAAYRYTVVRNADGIETARRTMEAFGFQLIGGGLFSTPFESGVGPVPLPDAQKAGVGRFATGFGDLITTRIPASVRVLYPVVSDGSAVIYNNTNDDPDDPGFVPGVHWTTDRWYGVDVTVADAVAGGQTVRLDASVVGPASHVVYDTEHAQRPETGQDPVNMADLASRATELAARYYGRYTCGAGQMLFIGTALAHPWPGGQVIEWRITSDGPRTRIRGSFDSPTLGMVHEPPATSIQGLGLARVRPVGDGGFAIDVAGGQPPTGVHLATITEVQAGTYKADAVWSDVSIDDLTVPADRRIPGVTYVEKAIGDTCLILEFPDGSFELHALEFYDTTECVTEATTSTAPTVPEPSGTVTRTIVREPRIDDLVLQAWIGV